MLQHEILWWLAAWLCISLLVSPLIGKLIRGPKCVRSRLWLVPRTAGRWPSCDPVGRPAKRGRGAPCSDFSRPTHIIGVRSHVSSPDALGVVRNLPGGVADAALHPAVVPARAVPDPQDDPESGGIGLVGELALRQVAAGLRIERVEPNTTVGAVLVDVLGPALADRPPMPSLDLRPLDLDGGSAFKILQL
jgi:hypothetical protein